MFTYIDNTLNKLTMYRVVMYVLFVLALVALLFSCVGWVGFSPASLLVELLVLVFFSYFLNEILARVYGVATNPESSNITALILFFLLLPPSSLSSLSSYIPLLVAAFGATASKYVLTWNKKHIFNPAAFGAFFVGSMGFGGAGWWVASGALCVPVFLAALLIVRKMRRFSMVSSFSLCAVLSTLVYILPTSSLVPALSTILLSYPIFFLGGFMLTEPLTLPPQSTKKYIYAAIVGILFGLQWHLGFVYSSPQLTLLLGNIFSFAVGLRRRLSLTLVDKKEVAQNTFHFTFSLPEGERAAFVPGQYMEWSLPHPRMDFRGIRRFFTIASAPSEGTIGLGVRVVPSNAPMVGSSFKQALCALPLGGVVTATNIDGSFVLPSDRTRKLLWIAGGIGVTPFRAMAPQLRGTPRDVVMLYANKTRADIAYKDMFDAAPGLRTLYVLTDEKETVSAPLYAAKIDATFLSSNVPDLTERLVYISGPHGMVEAYETLLTSLGVPTSSIKTDFFPGF